MLTNKIRHQISLPIELSEWIKEYSKESGIPITVIVEKALNKYKQEIKK